MVLLLLACGGCMSIVQTIEHDKKEVYIGTRTDIEAMGYFGTDEGAWAILGLIDLPFSLVMDTIFLPYTVPNSLLNDKRQNVPADEKSYKALISNQEDAPDRKPVR